MKRGFYFRLAATGISKNGKLYFPYILTCICMVMTNYIISFLAASEEVRAIRGGESMQSMLSLGIGVTAIFSVIFLYYTNSFLTRRRQKEFGLYHILGMGKASLVKILICENVMTMVVSIVSGLAFGVVFSKLGELILTKMLGVEAGLKMKVDLKSAAVTVVLFLFIFALIMARMILYILITKPVDMIKSEKVGEKPPKGNILIAVAGVILLAAAYRLAVTIEDPITAMVLFFVAVVMVIVATYMLFISGSVSFCRMLRKNKNYYYRTEHFVSVSSMIYRMKRNGAGLASICILSTMVLVMVSSVMCLWVGMEGMIKGRCPGSMVMQIESPDVFEEKTKAEDLTALAEKIVRDAGEKPEDIRTYKRLVSDAYQNGDTFVFDPQGLILDEMDMMSVARQFFVIPVDEFNKFTGEDYALGEDEVLVSTTKLDKGYPYDTITLEGCGTWKVKEEFEAFADRTDAYVVYPSVFLVVPDEQTVLSIRDEHNRVKMETGGEHAEAYQDETELYYDFNLSCDQEKQIELYKTISEAAEQYDAENGGSTETLVECRAVLRGEFVGLYGGLFFIGILLGSVFILGMVLIMYYKQISEGYEDQDRFDILMKVGMSEKEVKKSINSQVLTVFLLPLVTAGIHVAFAFPLVKKILFLLGIRDMVLLMVVTAGSFLVFGIFYMGVYFLTSKSYFSIVRGRKKR